MSLALFTIGLSNMPQQPTDFWLETYSLSHVFDTPELITSLAQYSEQPQDSDERKEGFHHSTEPQSVLFLRVQAAASYYSTNRTLMEYPEAVDVDISRPRHAILNGTRLLTYPVLDPFLLNILPRSLVPVAIYITAVAVGAWFLSEHIYRWLLSTIAEPLPKPHTD